MHQVTKQGRASFVAARVDVPWCPSCTRMFHTLRRCVHHISCDAPACEEAVVLHMTQLNAGAPYQEKRCRRKSESTDVHGIPAEHRAAVRAAGPLPA
eukprot:13028283-Alexandrium_andersonii.AAC.1